MALTPYKNQKSPLNRSRSSSCSSPVRNRIVYQEIYSMGANTLVRSYSCDQVFDKDESGRPFQTTQIQVSSFITPEKKSVLKSVKREQEPRRLAVNFPVDKPETPRKRMNSVPKQPNVKMTGLKRAAIFTLVTAASAWALYFFLRYRECGYVWDLAKTEQELGENIFGQSQALSKINSVLKACNSSSDIYVMVFTGSVGVGKTYSSSIISHNFPWSSNKLITYSEYFAADVSRLLNEKPSPCGCNLVIIDDLSSKTAKEAISVISLLNSERKKNENFLIILIFQSFSESDRSEITEEFKNAHVNFYLVPFKPLTGEVVRKCFEAEMQRQGVQIPEVELRKLVMEKMGHIDILQGTSGCKGVTEDVASYYEKNLKL